MIHRVTFWSFDQGVTPYLIDICIRIDIIEFNKPRQRFSDIEAVHEQRKAVNQIYLVLFNISTLSGNASRSGLLVSPFLNNWRIR